MEFCHIDLKEYDGILCVGGDGTVNRVVNGLLNRIQEIGGIEMNAGVVPHKSRLPVGIIPLGEYFSSITSWFRHGFVWWLRKRVDIGES